MKEYLTTKELAERIKWAPGSIRNLVYQKRLKKNVHYVKPSARKILFIWSSIEEWLKNGDDIRKTDTPKATPSKKRPRESCLIKI